MAPRSYGTLPAVENEWEPFNGGNGDIPAYGDNKKRKRMVKWTAVGLAGLAFVAFLGIHRSTSKGSQRPENRMSSTFHTVRTSSDKSFSSAAWMKSPESLGLYSVERDNLKPSKAWGRALVESGRPLPTNAWYLNLLSDQAGTAQNTEASRVYTVPYIIDTVGKIPGIRVHWPTLQTNPKNMQMVVDASNGVTLGATHADPHYQLAASSDGSTSLLGLALQWNATISNSTTTPSKKAEDSSMMVAPIGTYRQYVYVVERCIR
jgi:hypothetical protein